ncbi:MxaS protein [Methylibium sp.]|uniref:DUF58 domain-containing protein n=1 Tax=Methylibium sp. TaxID=2067992 RepID=UPI0017C40A5C|nr:MxaS protein [Methylibium sp.]MBA3591649.1 hypothetical protein [Methylibium sp.]
MKEFAYRVARPALAHFPGHHRSRRGDSGHEFRAHVPLHDAPDVRRLDLHASLRDPLGQWLVRVASERKAVPVYAVADLSASMAFQGERRKLDVLADFTEALAWSAWRTGDAFGFVGCDEAVRRDWLLPLVRSQGVGSAFARRLRAFAPAGRNADGLKDAHRLLRRERSLVFLLSDFHLPLPALDAVLGSLAHHELVPVLLWDRAEFAQPGEGPNAAGLPGGIGLASRIGRLASLVDAETGQRRLLWLRPALRERWRRQLEARRGALDALFRRHRLRPLYLLDGFDADAVTAHFHR